MAVAPKSNNTGACAGFFAGGSASWGSRTIKSGGNAFLGGGGGAYLSHKSTTSCQPGQGGQGFIHVQIINGIFEMAVYQVLNDSNEVVNTIAADEQFMAANHDNYRLVAAPDTQKETVGLGEILS